MFAFLYFHTFLDITYIYIFYLVSDLRSIRATDLRVASRRRRKRWRRGLDAVNRFTAK